MEEPSLSEKVFQYCLQNARIDVVQQAVKDNSLQSIAYKMKMELVGEFPELRGDNGGIGLRFGLVASEAFEKYKVQNHIVAGELLKKIDAKARLVKLLGKQHPDYLKNALEHDTMVEISNALQEPVNEFLRLYKSVQRKRGNPVSVRKKRKI